MRILFVTFLPTTKVVLIDSSDKKKIGTYEPLNGNPEEKNSTRAYSDMSREDAAAAGNRFGESSSSGSSDASPVDSIIYLSRSFS